MEKKYYILFLVTIFSIFFVIDVKAMNETLSADSYKIIQAGGENAYLQSKLQWQNKYDEKIGNRNYSLPINQISPLGGMTYTSLESYPIYLQDLNYYCGPASIKQIIQWITGSSNTQSYYASQMGTTASQGTIVYNMTVYGINGNQNQWIYGYTYVPDLANRTALWNIFYQNIFWDRIPVIIHARLEDLYMYNGIQGGHYITAVGITEDHLGEYWNVIHYVDSFSFDYGRGDTFGMHEIGLDELYNSLSSKGRYVIW